MNEAKAEAHYQRGLEAKQARELTRAIREFRLAIKLNSQHAEAYQELGCATYSIEGRLAEARTYLDAALTIDPALSDAHMYLGIVLNRLGELHDSEAHFRMALSLSDDPAIVHTTFAEEFLWHNGRYGEAEEHFRTALSLWPDLALALRNYARMLTCHGRDAEANGLFARAFEVDPDDRFTKRAYDEFLREIMSEDRDPDECLRAAMERDPKYIEGIICLSNRNK